MLKRWRKTTSPAPAGAGGASPAALPQTRAVDETWLTVLAVALFALYASTAQPVVGFDDAAGFAASCLNADIAHAPGYPLYALLCHPFSYLPVTTPALAAALFSAFCAAAAVWCLAQVVYRLTADAVLALGVAALYGVSRSYWSQATIPEVYTLNALLFFATLWALLRWREQPTTLRLAAVAGLCGLGLANHWPLFILGAAAFVPLLWRQRNWLATRLRRPKCLLLWGGVFVLGLLPYAYLMWRAHHPAAFVRLPFAPDSLASLWQIVSREVISPAIDNPEGSSTADKIGYALFLVKQVLLREITVLGGALAVLGLVLQWRQVGAAGALALCILFATATAGLVAMLNFLHDGLGEQTFAPYPLLPYAVVCIWAGLAVRRLLPKWRGAALAVLALLALGINTPYNNRSYSTLAADIAEVYLHTLPDGVVFFPLAPVHELLAYQQYVSGARPQVRILPPPNPYQDETITPTEGLYAPNTLTYEEELARVNAYARDNVVCYNTYVPFALDAVAEAHEYLLFSCLQPAGGGTVAGAADIVPRAQVNEGVMIFLRRLMRIYPQTPDWRARQLMARLLGDATRTLMQVRARGALPAEWGVLLEELSVTPAGQLALLEYLVAQPQLELTAARAELFRRAMEINLPYLNRRQQARLLSALADCFAAVHPREAAMLEAAQLYHQQAAALVAEASAPGVQAAWRFYQREGLAEAAEALELRHGLEALRNADIGQVTQ